MERQDEFRAQLRERVFAAPTLGLRCCAYLTAKRPLSHSEVVSLLEPNLGHQATVFRTLVSLSGAGLATITSRAGGIDRYELRRGGCYAAPCSSALYAMTVGLCPVFLKPWCRLTQIKAGDSGVHLLKDRSFNLSERASSVSRFS